MELKGLKVAFLGDSLTQGIGASARDRSYPSVFSEITEIAEGWNYGISGTRIARQSVPFRGCSDWDRDFLSRVEQIDERADCVVVCGSTNDYMHGDASLGCFDDRSVYTFYGAMHALLDKLKSRLPDAKIIFMTPPRFVEEESPSMAHIDKGHYFSEYISAIREVCAHHSVTVFDLHLAPELDPRDAEKKQRYYSDTVHLNDNGYRVVAERLKDFIMGL